MNYIKHLSGFFDRVVSDQNLNPTHISLYISLFQFWNVNRFINPISITRDEMMRISKICSKATYHKCMRDLHSKGYIKYQPSYNPFKGSLVTLIDLADDLKPQPKRVKTKPNNKQVNEQATEQALNKHQTSSGTSTGTGTEQALVPSKNIINIINISNITNKKNKKNFENFLNLDEQPKKNENDNDFFENIEKVKSSAKKEKENNVDFVHSSDIEKTVFQNSNPNIEQVKAFFNQNSFPEIEAQKFFNYFASNGWLVGGKTPMVNWNAAAENWMLNFEKFNPPENTQTNQNHLNVKIDKNYSEPL
jgi:hypothetical protein